MNYRIDYYPHGQSVKRLSEKATESELEAKKLRIRSTGHHIYQVYEYRPKPDLNHNVFAVRIVKGPVLYEGLTKERAEELRIEEEVDRPEYTIIAYNKKHSDSIKKNITK